MNNTTHLLEFMEKLIPAVKRDLKQGERDLEAAIIHNVSYQLSNSTKFLMPDDCDVGIGEVTDEVFQLARPPFDSIVLEWTESKIEITHSKEGSRLSKGKCVALVTSIENILRLIPTDIRDILDEQYSKPVRESNSYTAFVVVPFMQVEGLHFSQWSEPQFAIGVLVRPDGSRLVRDLALMPFSVRDEAKRNGESVSEYIDKSLHSWASFATVATKAMACLNASNVNSVTLPAPDKLNKKRLKNGKPPFFEYKILDIFLGADHSDLHSKDARNSIEGWMNSGKRLHAVRGHLMRSHGMIVWRRSHMRGNPERGAIVKDYQVVNKAKEEIIA